jgi:acetyltransferase-like isoleucine patch superfamily enzyme
MNDYFQHSLAVVEPDVSIGRGTRIWAFAHIVKGAIIGEDCNICDHTFIEGRVRVGNRVTIKSGVFLWEGLEIEDDVFIGPGAVFTNDDRPRSGNHLKDYLKTLLKQGASIGANSTTLPKVTIGRWAMVGAGSVVTRNVPDFGLVMGCPARLKGWVCRCGLTLPGGTGRHLVCSCGRSYDLIAENELKETGG